MGKRECRIGQKLTRKTRNSGARSYVKPPARSPAEVHRCPSWAPGYRSGTYKPKLGDRLPGRAAALGGGRPGRAPTEARDRSHSSTSAEPIRSSPTLPRRSPGLPAGRAPPPGGGTPARAGGRPDTEAGDPGEQKRGHLTPLPVTERTVAALPVPPAARPAPPAKGVGSGAWPRPPLPLSSSASPRPISGRRASPQHPESTRPHCTRPPPGRHEGQGGPPTSQVGRFWGSEEPVRAPSNALRSRSHSARAPSDLFVVT